MVTQLNGRKAPTRLTTFRRSVKVEKNKLNFMKKKYKFHFSINNLNGLILILIFCSITSGFFLGINSCSKLADNVVNFSSFNSKKIIDAKLWFENFSKKNEFHPFFNNINYFWNNATVFKYPNGNEIIRVPIRESFQNPFYKGQRILCLFPWKDGRGYYTAVYEFLSDSIENHKQINTKNYNGLVCVWDLKKGFIDGIKYKSGIGISNFKIEISKINNVSTSILVPLTETLPNVTVIGAISPSVLDAYTILMQNILSGYNLSLSFSANPCEYSDCSGMNSGFDGFDGVDSDSEPENNEDFNNIPELKEFKNFIEDPCLAEVFAHVISNSFNNNITNILHNTFNATNDYNLLFMDGNLNDNSLDAYTYPPIPYQNSRIELQIILNTGVLKGASNEYIAATIYHEVIHAYKIARGNGFFGDESTQHQTMALNYLNSMIDFLRNAYPNLTRDEAEALSWGGLERTPIYAFNMRQNPNRMTDLAILNQLHRTKKRGTICN